MSAFFWEENETFLYTSRAPISNYILNMQKVFILQVLFMTFNITERKS